MDEELEAEIRRRRDQGDLAGAAEAGIRGYGPAILGFIAATLRGGSGSSAEADAEAEEIFAQLCEDLWTGLSGFEWRCAFRTWAYTLARNGVARALRDPARRRRRLGVPLSRASSLAAEVRSRTRPYLRTEIKDGLARLRASLDPDDQMLLVLRIDRGMSWREVAWVTCNEVEPGEDDLRKASARARKRFQKIKDDLRRRAEAEGLLGGDDA
jgi:RNA polymerase sigma-70 factor (ECF subfamily)